MNILLVAINAKYIHSNLAVYSLKSYAREYQEHIQLLEYTINQNVDDILKGIYKEKPQVICFSCYIWNISYVKLLVKELRKLLPQVPIWLGGPEVSYDPKEELDSQKEVTGIMIGEGEKTFLNLVKAYLDCEEEDTKEGPYFPSAIKTIKGIAYRDGDSCVINPPRDIMDMSEIPFPYDKIEDFEHKIIYYESSRGCPFSCSYCLSSVDKRLRFRDLKLVKQELQFFIDKKVPQVKFVDRTFNCKHEHAMEIWQFLIEADNGITNFHFEVAADLLNDEEIALIQSMRKGLIQFEIGVQSTNLKTLDTIKRKMDFSKVAEVVKRLQEKENIHQHLDLIAGLPFEDYDSFRHSFNDVYALQPEQLQLGFLKVLKGSNMYLSAREYQCEYQERPPYEVLKTKWLGFEQVLQLKQVEEMVELYYNSGQFTCTLPKLLQLVATPFDFYQSLGEFYEKKGYDQISHSRVRRYDILLEFSLEVLQAQEEEVKQVLLFDLYLRENVKSRPLWASDRAAVKKEIRDLYLKLGRKQDTRSHIERIGERWVLFDYECRNLLTHNATYSYVE